MIVHLIIIEKDYLAKLNNLNFSSVVKCPTIFTIYYNTEKTHNIIPIINKIIIIVLVKP